MDFRDTLIGTGTVILEITDRFLLASAIAERELNIACIGDVVAWYKETGEILPGVCVKEADGGEED